MTPTQFEHAIDKLGLTQRAMAKILGHSERTARFWVSGKSKVPPTVAILTRLMLSGKITPDDVEEALGPRDARLRPKRKAANG